MEQKKEISTIEFYGNSISLIENNGVEYVAMRPIVEGIGLDWGTQQKKLSDNKDKFNCRHMPTVGADGKKREMLCIPLKKLNGYLFSINAEKVNHDIKNKVILYQEECFTTLYTYFHDGYSLNSNVLKNDIQKRDKLSEELRQLRISDIDLYKKLRNAISVTCTDYKSKDNVELGKFFASLQDSFHFAVSGFTASELVYHNVDSKKENVGMKSYTGNADHITQADVKIGKNFLDAKSFKMQSLSDVLSCYMISFCHLWK